jgi:hypothetical protein
VEAVALSGHSHTFSSLFLDFLKTMDPYYADCVAELKNMLDAACADAKKKNLDLASLDAKTADTWSQIIDEPIPGAFGFYIHIDGDSKCVKSYDAYLPGVKIHVYAGPTGFKSFRMTPDAAKMDSNGQLGFTICKHGFPEIADRFLASKVQAIHSRCPDAKQFIITSDHMGDLLKKTLSPNSDSIRIISDLDNSRTQSLQILYHHLGLLEIPADVSAIADAPEVPLPAKQAKRTKKEKARKRKNAQQKDQPHAKRPKLH